MIKINMQYYAQLREQAGTSSEQVMTSAATLQALYEELRDVHNFNLPLQALKVAVNTEFSDWSRALSDNDTVVFIPPVAGG